MPNTIFPIFGNFFESHVAATVLFSHWTGRVMTHEWRAPRTLIPISILKSCGMGHHIVGEISHLSEPIVLSLLNRAKYARVLKEQWLTRGYSRRIPRCEAWQGLPELEKKCPRCHQKSVVPPCHEFPQSECPSSSWFDRESINLCFSSKRKIYRWWFVRIKASVYSWEVRIGQQ